MTRHLSSLKWLTILGPVVIVALFAYAAYFELPAFLSPVAVYLALILLVGISAYFFSHAVFNTLAARENELERRQRELAALHQVSEAVSSTLDLPQILSQAIDAVLELTHADAGRIWLVEDDTAVLRNTVHRGLFPDAFAAPPTTVKGEGVVGSVASSGRAERILDLEQANDPELESLHARGFVEVASVPLSSKARVVGVLDVAARRHGELDPEAMGLLTSIGQEIALAVENARLFDSARTRQNEAESLYKAGMDVSSKLDLSQVLKTVTDRGRTLLNVDASALCLWDEQKRWLVVGSESGPADAFESQAGLGRRIAQKIGILRVDAGHTDDQCVTCALVRAPYCRTHVEMPVRVDDQIIGCLCVSSARSRTFSEREIEVLGGLANQAAIAIQNARAFDRAGNAATAMERERLAREMHDTLAQVLGFVNTKSQAVRELLAQGKVEPAQEQVEQLIGLSQELYADVREVILGLRAAISPDKSLLPALAGYVQAYTKQSGIETQLVVEHGAGELTFAPAVELQLIRIVQESLTNIRKHAHAQHANIRFSVLDGHAEMRIEDDGKGFDPSHIARGDWPQFGLQTMRERAESVGGAFVVVSKPQTGTQIVVQIPLGYSGGR